MSPFLIKARAVITCNSDWHIFAPGGVVVDGGLITAVGSLAEVTSLGPFAAEYGDETTDYVMPGLVNGHHHSLRPNRGRRFNGPSELALVQMRRRRLPSLTNEELRDHTLWTAGHLLLSGVTSFLDGFPADPKLDDFGLESCVAGYVQSGIRVAICVRCSDRANFTYEDDNTFLARLPAAVKEVITTKSRPFDINKFLGVWTAAQQQFDEPSGRIRIGLGPTGDLWCSDAMLVRLREAAAPAYAPIQSHLLQSPYEAVAAADRYGCSSVEHLHQLGFLGPSVSFAHARWMTDHDIELLVTSGSPAIVNPASGLRAGGGLAPLQAMIASGCKVGLGLDAAGLNTPFDMFTEMRLAMATSVIPGEPRAGLGPRDVLRLATAGSATAMCMDSVAGELAPGRAADAIVLDARTLAPSPYGTWTDDPTALIVSTAAPRSIRRVFVDGQVVVEDGRIPGVDMGAVDARVRESVMRVDPLLEQADAEFRAVLPFLNEYFGSFQLAGRGLDMRGYGVVDPARLVRGIPPDSESANPKGNMA